MKDCLKRIAAVFLSVAMAVTFMPVLGMNPEKAHAATALGSIELQLAKQAYSFSAESDAVKMELCFKTLAKEGTISITKEQNSTVSYDVNGDNIADVYCQTRYNDNGRPMSSTYGVTSSCSAQGKMDFTVSKEQVEAYIATCAGVYTDNDSFYSRLTLYFSEPVVIPEPAPKIVNKGKATIDLSKGALTMKGTKQEVNALYFTLYYLNAENDIIFEMDPDKDYIFYRLDLDKNNTWDASITVQVPQDSTGIGALVIEKLNTCSIKDSFSAALKSDYISQLETMSADEDLDSFYSSVTFVFAKATTTPVITKKLANTLTLTGKTFKIKYKKLKKKSQTYAISKFLTVSKARGKVTYTKVSGNKKITISKDGKVTLKKKLKKGTYRVKVKVTAAGTKSYKKGTKTAVFTVKVTKK